MIANLLNPFSMGLRAGRPAKTIFWQFQSRSTIRYLLQSWEIGTVLQPVAWNTNELAFVSMVPEIRPVDTESISVSLGRQRFDCGPYLFLAKSISAKASGIFRFSECHVEPPGPPPL
jgi:hypothetical protein